MCLWKACVLLWKGKYVPQTDVQFLGVGLVSQFTIVLLNDRNAIHK